MKMTPALSLLVGASCLIPGAMRAQVFSGAGLGAIPDSANSDQNPPADWGAPLLVTFNVSGLAQQIGDLSLSITMNHSYAGDLDVQLFGPGGNPGDPGAQGFVIFSRLGQQADQASLDAYGSTWRLGAYHYSNSELILDSSATYVFNDSASGNLWSTVGFNTSTGEGFVGEAANIPAGGYRTSVSGPWDAAGNPKGGNHNAGQFTSFATDSGFVGLAPAQANGTWTLRIRDGGINDVGDVSAASLTITAVPEPAHYAMAVGLGLIIFAGYRRYSPAKA